MIYLESITYKDFLPVAFLVRNRNSLKMEKKLGFRHKRQIIYGMNLIVKYSAVHGGLKRTEVFIVG